MIQTFSTIGLSIICSLCSPSSSLLSSFSLDSLLYLIFLLFPRPGQILWGSCTSRILCYFCIWFMSVTVHVMIRLFAPHLITVISTAQGSCLYWFIVICPSHSSGHMESCGGWQQGRCTDKLTAVVIAHTRPEQIQARQNPNMEMAGVKMGMKPHPWVRTYWQWIAMDEGQLVFFKGVTPGRSTGLWGRPHTQEYLGSTLNRFAERDKNLELSG